MSYGWGALGFCVLAGMAGLVFAGSRGLAAWRGIRSLRGALDGRLAELGRNLTGLERRTAELPVRLEELAAAQAQLRRSLARARLLQAAAQDALAPVQRLRAALPRKQL